MSLILRSLMRDPFVTRPLSRAMKRFNDDFWYDDWPMKRVRRVSPDYELSPIRFVDDMNRQMAAAVNRMQEFADDLDALDALVERLDHEGRRLKTNERGTTIVKKTESGGLQLALDIGEFKPEDLKVKLVDDTLVIEAVNESSGEDSYRLNHFKKWFRLPEGCKMEEIRSKLTKDNKLLIDLPSDRPLEEKRDRSIPIEMEKPATAQQEGATAHNGDAAAEGHRSAASQ